jgi:hypothetical protein
VSECRRHWHDVHGMLLIYSSCGRWLVAIHSLLLLWRHSITSPRIIPIIVVIRVLHVRPSRQRISAIKQSHEDRQENQLKNALSEEVRVVRKSVLAAEAAISKARLSKPFITRKTCLGLLDPGSWISEVSKSPILFGCEFTCFAKIPQCSRSSRDCSGVPGPP